MYNGSRTGSLSSRPPGNQGQLSFANANVSSCSSHLLLWSSSAVVGAHSFPRSSTADESKHIGKQCNGSWGDLACFCRHQWCHEGSSSRHGHLERGVLAVQNHHRLAACQIGPPKTCDACGDITSVGHTAAKSPTRRFIMQENTKRGGRPAQRTAS